MDMGYWNARAELAFAFNAFVRADERYRRRIRSRRASPTAAKTTTGISRSVPIDGLAGVKNAAILEKTADEARAAVAACRAVETRTGISVALPIPSDYRQFRAFYKALDFARDTQWDEYLDRHYGIK